MKTCLIIFVPVQAQMFSQHVGDAIQSDVEKTICAISEAGQSWECTPLHQVNAPAGPHTINCICAYLGPEYGIQNHAGHSVPNMDKNSP